MAIQTSGSSYRIIKQLAYAVLFTGRPQRLAERNDEFYAIYDSFYRLYRETAWCVVKRIIASNTLRLQGKLLTQNNDERFTTVRVAGFELQFDLQSPTDAIMLKQIKDFGLYEKATCLLLMNILRQGNTFVDVGAHNGYYSLLASRLVAENGRVFSFEPSANALRRLRVNLEINHVNNVAVIPKAAWNESATLRLHISEIEDGMNSLFPTDRSGAVTIDAVTLDSVLEENEVDLVKIDVEGAEKEVLMGAKNLLKSKKIGRIILEWNKQYPIYPTLREWDRRFDYFRSVGDLFQVSDDGAAGYRVTGPVASASDLPIYCNLMIVPK